jgi:hypothetical protein
MGMIISPYTAGALIGRHERIIRGWIACGQLLASKNEQGKWKINTDDLLAAPRVTEAQKAHIRAWVADRGTTATEAEE